MEYNQQEFQELIQVAQFINLDHIEKKKILTNHVKKTELRNYHVIFFDGHILAQNYKDQQFMKHLEYQLIKIYSKVIKFNQSFIVFFSDSKLIDKSFLTLLHTIRKSPQIANTIEKFIVFDPSIFLKGYLFFKVKRFPVKYLMNLREFLDEEFFDPRFFGELPKHLHHGVDYEILYELYGQEEMNTIEKPYKYGMDISEYQNSKEGLPIVLEKMLNYLEDNPNRLQTLMIFRKSSDESMLKNIIEQIEKGQWVVFQQIDELSGPILIANAIKRFLTSLKQSIFNQVQIDSIVNANEEYFNLFLVEKVEKNFSIHHKLIFERVISLFVKINQLQEFNKMDSQSLSIIFAPCLMKLEPNLQFQLKLKAVSKYIQFVIDNFI